MALTHAQRELRAAADKDKAQQAQRFFKTGPGQYGEGDKFLGVRVPRIRQLVRQHSDLTLTHLADIIQSDWHEERLFAVLAMVALYEKGDAVLQKQVFNSYLKHLRYVNNWDLVDASAYKIIGPYLMYRDRKRAYTLARSPNLWRRRVGIMSSLYWIKQGDVKDAYALCRLLMNDKEDLIHKASGWMLREAGKIDKKELIQFLERYHGKMPRTMLRYAIEHLPATTRRRYV